MNAAARPVAGLDIGGTSIDGVLLAADGRPIARARHPSGHGPDEVVANAAAVIAQMRAAAGVDAISAMGIGVPGTVDPAAGVVTHAVNLGISSIPLAARVGALAGARVVVENDVNVAALGRHHGLAQVGDAPRSLAYLNVGTGLAAGIVIGGEILRGASGNAGEIGHLAVDENMLSCPCGQSGCLETVASGSALERQWGADAADPGRGVVAAARRGDERARAILRRLHHGLATAVLTLVLTTDCERVVFGGGVGSLGTVVLDGVRGALRRRSARSRFLASLRADERIAETGPGADAARAAAILARTTDPGSARRAGASRGSGGTDPGPQSQSTSDERK